MMIVKVYILKKIKRRRKRRKARKHGIRREEEI